MADATIVEAKPTKKKLALAMQKHTEAMEKVADLQKIMAKMSPRQRQIFACLSRGMDALRVVMEIGEQRFYAGVVRNVYLRDGTRVLARKLTKDQVDDLSYESYQRLLSICEAGLRRELGGMVPQKFANDITEFFRVMAPDAFQVLAGLMHGDWNGQKVTPPVALKASTEILDRAGYEKRASKASKELPVTVNIIMDQRAIPEVVVDR